MAEEINFIRPQEVYDRNNGESKVRYRSYDGNDRFIPVVDGEKGVPKTMVEVTHAELKAMRDGGKLTAGALYRITDYQCTTTQENTQSAGHQFDIVLLALSENKLAEEGWAMEHPTDVYDVTFSDGVTKKCYIYQPDDEYVYIVDCETLLGTTEVSEDVAINENTATVDDYSTELTEENLPYNYFQNSNLSAWKVWYCLDNDTARFAWADDNVIGDIENIVVYYPEHTGIGWTVPAHDVVYTPTNETQIVNGVTYFKLIKLEEGYISDMVELLVDTKNINTETTLYGLDPRSGTIRANTGNISIKSINYNTPPTEEGRGVIYRLIDEFNNDIKYDFKNIQFKRTITNGQYDANGTETWCYTLNVWYNSMCQDASIVGNTLPNDEGFVNGVYDNKFGYVTAYNLYLEGVNTFAFALGNNVVLSIDEGEYYGIYSNTIGNSFFSNTIGTEFYHNMIGNGFNNNMISSLFYDNTIGNLFNSNTIGNNFAGNMIGYNFQSNTIGNRFNNNMIGNNFVEKTISDNTYYKNYGSNGVELATK